MNPPKDTIQQLVEKLMFSDNPREQVEIAGDLLARTPDSGRDIQMLNRAIRYFKDEHPEAYDRAKSPTLRPCRSIPPSTTGGAIEYLRLEEACTRLIQAKSTWTMVLKEIKAGLYKAPRNSDKDEFRNALREMDAIGRRKNQASKPKSASDARKPKRRLHS